MQTLRSPRLASAAQSTNHLPRSFGARVNPLNLRRDLLGRPQGFGRRQ